VLASSIEVAVDTFIEGVPFRDHWAGYRVAFSEQA
jgi:hypothetical protein